MTKQELAGVLIERFKARGFKASQWHDRLYITKPTPDQANISYTYGYVELVGDRQVRIDTTKCTSPEARAIAREKIEAPEVIDPDPGPNVHTDRHQRDMRSMQIETLRRNIYTYGAAYGCQVDDLVKLVEKDTAQRYEAIIAQRVADTVKQEITLRMPDLKREAFERALDRFSELLSAAKADIQDACTAAFDDIEANLDEDR